VAEGDGTGEGDGGGAEDDGGEPDIGPRGEGAMVEGGAEDTGGGGEPVGIRVIEVGFDLRAVAGAVLFGIEIEEEG